jgi:hypothetical protein
MSCPASTLQGEHGGGGFVDMAGECDRTLQNRFQAVAVLDAGGGILVLDDERGPCRVDVEEFPGRELMVEPVDGPVLEVGQRIMACGAR